MFIGLQLVSGSSAQSQNQALPGQIAELEQELALLESSNQIGGYKYLVISDELSAAHHELGVSMSRAGDMAAATKHFERASELDQANYDPSDPVVLKSANSLATNYNFLGRYRDAENLLRSLLVQADAKSSRELNLRWTIVNTLAGSLTGQNRLLEAEVILRQTRAQIKATGQDTDQSLLTLINNNLAHNLHQQGQFGEAEPLFREVVAYYLAMDSLESSEGMLAAHNLATNLIDLQRFGEALNLAAATYAKRVRLLGSDHPDSLTSLSTLGLATLGLDDVPSSIDIFEQALDKKTQRLGIEHPDSLASAIDLAEALLKDPDRSASAIDYIAPAAKILRDRVLKTGSGVDDQSQYARDIEDIKMVHRLLIEAAWQSKRSDRQGLGFEAAQVILNGATSQAVAQKAANRVANAAGLQPLVELREQLSQEWHRLDDALLKMISTPDTDGLGALAEMAEQRKAIVRRVDSIDAQIASVAPDYFALVRPASLSIAEAQKLLQADEAAIMVIPTIYATHIFLITHHDIGWSRSNWTESQIDQAVKRLLWDVGANIEVSVAESLKWEQQGSGAYPFDFETAHALYEQLIKPGAKILEEKTILFISASGKLSTMPFAIMVSEIPDGPTGSPQTLRSAQWFSDKIAQVHIPSLQSLKFLRSYRGEQEFEDTKPFIGFGDPVLAGVAETRGAKRGGSGGISVSLLPETDFNLADEQETTFADATELKNMARLPGTATELTAIWKAFGEPDNALFLGDQATEKRVRSTNLSAEVISFATHGLLAGEIHGMLEPGLVLSPPDFPSSTDDGYLSSSEIAGLEVSSKWVILSACNTAGGNKADGEGLSGLARSFFFAGATSLLASHWPVRDQVAARMTVTATNITRDDSNQTPAQALQHAMKEIRDEIRFDSDTDTWAHPNAWAPFVIVGER